MIEYIAYWPNGSIRDHDKYNKCGGELKSVNYDNEGNLTSEQIFHGIEDIYSFYQIVYLDPENPAPGWHTETKSELSLKTIYNEKGKLRDSINDLYPDVFPNKVGDWSTFAAIGREKRHTSYSKNGNISMNSEYLYGELIGRQVNYNENNQLISELNYIPVFDKGYFSSRVDGLSETYFKGVLEETSTTEYGTIVGYCFGVGGGFKDGPKDNPDFSYDYVEGNRIKEKHEEGELHVKSWFDGPVKFYCGDNRDPKRNLICEVNYIEGEPDGKFTALGCSGGDFSRTGYEIEFEYDNGKLLSKTVSDNGVIISKNVY
jgi:antitoxin component YwqK of YwqJK toxin-antitoxin module